MSVGRMVNRHRVFGGFAVVFLAVALPRLAALGGLPATDEGIYAYWSQVTAASLLSGRRLADAGGIALYPILSSWIFFLDANHLLLLRVSDAVVSAVACLTLYLIILRECRDGFVATIIAFIFIMSMNSSLFIDSGFKNSIFAAYIPLLWACISATNVPEEADNRFYLSGSLVAMAVLLREPFAPFAVLGAISIYIGYGRRYAIEFCVGGLVAAVAILSVIFYLRGGWATAIDSYAITGKLYDAVGADVFKLFKRNGNAFLITAIAPLFLASAICILSLFQLTFTAQYIRQLGFWMFAAAIPLLEPALKVGFPYHFAVSLPGIACLTARVWDELIIQREKPMKVISTSGGILGLSILFLAPQYVSIASGLSATKRLFHEIGSQGWPAEYTQQSNYLIAADAIKRAAGPHATLSVSGFMQALFPLTGLSPASYDSANLTELMMRSQYDEVVFLNALRKCAPDVVMTTTRKDWPGSEAITNAITNSGLYEPFEVVPTRTGIAYGRFGGTVYKRIAATGPSCL